MAGDDASFAATWRAIPPVTRYVGTAVVVLWLLSLPLAYYAGYFWLLPHKRWQPWRWLGAPLAYQGKPLYGLLTAIQLCAALQRMELSIMRSASALTLYLLFCGAVFDIVGPYVGMYAYLGGIFGAISYTMAQESPLEMTSWYGVIQMRCGYLPWANVLVGYLMGGTNGMLEPLIGIMTAHMYLFLDEILPSAGGPRLMGPLKMRLERFIPQPGEDASHPGRNQFGRGHRLGQ